MRPLSKTDWLNKVPEVTLSFWIIKIMSTTVGETCADYLAVDAGLGQGVTSIGMALSIRQIVTPRRELFYWATVLCTFALGTAAGDLATEALGLGFTLGALIFAALITVTLVAWRLGGNAVLTFWIAYILTRPFGAALGDVLTQAKTCGGLGATWTSAIFLCVR